MTMGAKLPRSFGGPRLRAGDAADEPDIIWTATILHELRQPLTAVAGYAQLMQRRGSYDANALESIVEATQRLAHLVDDLLDVASLTAGQVVLRPSAVDLVASSRHRSRRPRGSPRAMPSACRRRGGHSSAGGTPTGWLRSWQTCSPTPSSTRPVAARYAAGSRTRVARRAWPSSTRGSGFHRPRCHGGSSRSIGRRVGLRAASRDSGSGCTSRCG